MYVRSTSSRVDVAKIKQATAAFREHVIPLCRQQTGFKGGYVLADRASGKASILTLWESEVAARAIDGNGVYRQNLAQLAPFLMAPPVLELFEVIVQM
ncbi:MAG: hypothetical protein HZB55_06950 [Deltaproteobacteria bacterium]|nr:hypothetical protein [Deltaproteobacteria bacterium]